MEQPCYKCGQAVDEGIPFCPHCAAPQIRVVLAEPALSPAAIAPAMTRTAVGQPIPSVAISMPWSESVQPCAIAAAIAAVTMVLKLVVPAVAVLGAGFLAVAFYRRRIPEARLNAIAGARLGALCGFFCFGITTILESLAILLLHRSEQVRATLLDAIRQTAARYPDPQFQASLDFMRSPTGLVLMMVCLLILAFIAFVLLGSLGGVLGGAALGRRDRP
jgi:hypothetical protein